MPRTDDLAGEEWTKAWQEVVDQVGIDFDPGEPRYVTDRIEAGAIRRYLEPLEFDCPLHYDAAVARAHGFADVTVPYTALPTFALDPVWLPGESVFTSRDRNAQPARISMKPTFPPGTPHVTGYFATETEIEFIRPVTAGEMLGVRGNRLVACSPKETKVGRGAFLTFESLIVDEDGQTVSVRRSTVFLYNPHQADAA